MLKFPKKHMLSSLASEDQESSTGFSRVVSNVPSNINSVHNSDDRNSEGKGASPKHVMAKPEPLLNFQIDSLD